MSKVKLIIFGGCYTALGSDNIAKRANTRGARTSLGWTVSIGASSHSEWFDNFLYRLSGGRTVQAAVNYTNDFSYDDNGVKNVVIYGDGNYVPSWDNGVATYSLPSNLRSDNKRYEVSIELENNYTIDNIKEKIDSYIKNNLDNEFDINNYQYDITGTGNKKYYDFKLLINGAISDSAYTIIVENNEIVAIVDNTKEISNNISTYSSNNINSDEQEELANKIKNNIIEENSNYEVISQKLKNIYISEENAYKTLILTEVHDKLTDSYFVKEDIL